MLKKKLSIRESLKICLFPFHWAGENCRQTVVKYFSVRRRSIFVYLFSHSTFLLKRLIYSEFLVLFFHEMECSKTPDVSFLSGTVLLCD